MADPTPLTSKQRAHLRGLGHALSPSFHVGKEGVTAEAAKAAAEAFRSRELLKVRVLEAAPEDARTSAHALAERIDGAVVVQVLGRNAVLYRRHPERPAIDFPIERRPPPRHA